VPRAGANRIAARENVSLGRPFFIERSEGMNALAAASLIYYSFL
jgi:hypothetical protein